MAEQGRRVASIDIGTNTINLLIAEQDTEDWRRVYWQRTPVGLGQGAMNTGHLQEEAILRALDALRHYKKSIEDHACLHWKTTATSAVRTAANGNDFVLRVKSEIGLDVEVIDGEREAELIYKGVRSSGAFGDGVQLIMDIGGGSTEFILADGKDVFWKQSFKLGVTRLLERFRFQDPIDEHGQRRIRTFFRETAAPLWKACETHPPQRLIGASGSFNTLVAMLLGVHTDRLSGAVHHIELAAFDSLAQQVIDAAPNDRAQIPGMPADRVPTMPYALFSIMEVLDQVPVRDMYRSAYALKEGVISEMISA